MTNKPDRLSQNKMIAKHLKAGGSISPLRALEMFSCMRLASRIYDLSNPPYSMSIKSELIHEGNYKFAKYTLNKRK